MTSRPEEIASRFVELKNRFVKRMVDSLAEGCESDEALLQACNRLRSIVQTSVDLSFASYGVPSNIPANGRLIDQGAEYLASTFTHLVFSQSPVEGGLSKILVPSMRDQVLTDAR